MVTTSLASQLWKLVRGLFAFSYVQERRDEIVVSEVDVELALAEYYSYSDAVLMTNGCSDVQ